MRFREREGLNLIKIYITFYKVNETSMCVYNNNFGKIRQKIVNTKLFIEQQEENSYGS